MFQTRLAEYRLYGGQEYKYILGSFIRGIPDAVFKLKILCSLKKNWMKRPSTFKLKKLAYV
eukprot:snap_masked-scaffold_30-processed-gene-1.35-mRNA-1 protein AED:1.00 eAED:1.00 QI:0/-1/0/0/-1/1/1/0/60